MQTIVHLPYDDNAVTPEDKRILNAFLPDHSNGCCIFFIHGGGWSGGSPELWSTVAEHFCEQGYVCVSAGYRLIPETRLPQIFEDTRLAYSFVKDRAAEWGFDPLRMAVWGSSAGGHLAAMLATTAPGDDFGYSIQMTERDTRPSAGVYCCPVFSLLPTVGFSILDREDQFLGSDPQENLKLARLLSPMERLSPETPPLFIIQGDMDDSTPLAHQKLMLEQCALHGVAAEMVVLPGVGHGFGYGVTNEAQQSMLVEGGRFLRDFFKLL